jgi:hypothetical protein
MGSFRQLLFAREWYIADALMFGPEIADLV